MNINFIFRSKKHQYFSIENVFDTIIKELSKDHKIENSYVPERTTSLMNMLINTLSVIKLKGDIYHITGDIHYVALALKKNKTILTIHDLVTLNNRTGLKKIFFETMWFRIPISKCRYITAISQKTADELCDKFPKAREKVYVINNPVDISYKFTPTVFNEKLPVILQIGTRDNKNLERVIKSIENLQCLLDIVGILSEEQLTLLKEKKINYVNTYNITNEEMVKKYQNCDIVMFVSTYEGFGMPVIEAQTVGRVVITSNISPMKEISGDGTCLVDPYDVESIRNGFLKIISDESYRQELINYGKMNVEKYTANAIANDYLKLYEKVLDN